jgi:hypothetical protein
MKLTKTQHKLLANQRHGRVHVESYQGQGPEGGMVSSGSRERSAANKLIELGILEKINSHLSTNVKNGYSIHICSTIYSVTPNRR